MKSVQMWISTFIMNLPATMQTCLLISNAKTEMISGCVRMTDVSLMYLAKEDIMYNSIMEHLVISIQMKDQLEDLVYIASFQYKHYHFLAVIFRSCGIL